MHRTLRILVTLAVTPVAALSAGAQTASGSSNCDRPGNANQTQTIFQNLGVEAAHYDVGEYVRVLNGIGAVNQQRVMVSFCRWAGYSVGITQGDASGLTFNTGETPEAARTDPHRATLSLLGFEMQWRLGKAGAIQPVLSLAGGAMSAGWQYISATPPAGSARPTADPRSSTSYGATAAGLEFNLFTYLHADLMTGARFMGSLSTPGLSPRPLQGSFISASLKFGGF